MSEVVSDSGWLRRDPRWAWEKRLQRWFARMLRVEGAWAAYERRKYSTAPTEAQALREVLGQIDAACELLRDARECEDLGDIVGAIDNALGWLESPYVETARSVAATCPPLDAPLPSAAPGGAGHEQENT